LALCTCYVLKIAANMRQTWLRLVVCVSLMAFLAANTPAGITLVLHLLAGQTPAADDPRSHCDLAHSHEEEVTDDSESLTCCTCGEDKARSCQASQHPEERDTPCGPSCPACPGSPSDPKCPCPGGCALCSVAKVPCVVPSVCVTCSAPCLGANSLEPHPVYTSPFTGRLIRPPRA